MEHLLLVQDTQFNAAPAQSFAWVHGVPQAGGAEHLLLVHETQFKAAPAQSDAWVHGVPQEGGFEHLLLRHLLHPSRAALPVHSASLVHGLSQAIVGGVLHEPWKTFWTHVPSGTPPGPPPVLGC